MLIKGKLYCCTRRIVVLLIAGMCTNSLAFASDVAITKYGAVGDGKTLNTVAIQQAIDDCSNSGGGKVYVAAGNWLCGTILLKNHVVLSLAEKAVLLGSTNIEDYKLVEGFRDGNGQDLGYCFVGAVDVQGAGIEGKGTIDGQGKAVQTANGKTKRPFLIRFIRCKNIHVKNLHLHASTAWTMHIFRCEKVKVEGVEIFSRGLANNDGIDIDCCEKVEIKNCAITSDDDAICLKTTSPYPCKNIMVSGIKIRTNCAAIKLGTESTGDFENINISGITVTYAGLGIVKLFSVDGSHLHHIDITDIDADTVNLPIMIRLGARLKTFRSGDEQKPVGIISDIRIRNITVKNATVAGILCTGVPEHLIDGILLQNISIHLNGGGTLAEASIKLAENEAAYPEIRMFGKTIPTYGLYVRHCKNAQFRNITFTTNKPDERPAIIADDVANIHLTGWKLPVMSTAGTLVHFSSVNTALAKGFVLSQQPAAFLSVEGKQSRGIRLQQVQFVSDYRLIQLGNEVVQNAVQITQ